MKLNYSSELEKNPLLCPDNHLALLLLFSFLSESEFGICKKKTLQDALAVLLGNRKCRQEGSDVTDSIMFFSSLMLLGLRGLPHNLAR